MLRKILSLSEIKNSYLSTLSLNSVPHYIDVGCRRITGLGSENDGAREPEDDTGTVLFLYQELSARRRLCVYG